MKSSSAAIIGLVLGLPLFIFGMKEIIQANRFVSGAEQTDGIVIEMNEKPTKYYPRVRFQTRTGETIEFSSGNGSNPPLYEVNDPVTVLYHPANPRVAVIDSFIEIWLGPFIYAGLGLLLLIASGVGWIKSKW